MKLGFVSSILPGYTFEQVMDFAGKMGFSCVEAACWPFGKAERRYAGVSHIDVENKTHEYIAHIKDYEKKTGVAISSLAYYPNIMSNDENRNQFNIKHLKSVIEMSDLLGINMVTTFIGRNQYKTVEENIELFKKVWPPIIQFAEEHRVVIAIENCPMLFGPEQWPGGQNLATTPAIWKKLFSIIDTPYFGINYDPSHFVWQGMDYIKPIYEFKDKIHHVHFKDIKLYPERLREVGIMAYPLEYMEPKIPGLGDVEWGPFVSALTDIGYDGFACIEIEDRAFESSEMKILDSIRLAKRYIEQFVI